MNERDLKIGGYNRGSNQFSRDENARKLIKDLIDSGYTFGPGLVTGLNRLGVGGGSRDRLTTLMEKAGYLCHKGGKYNTVVVSHEQFTGDPHPQVTEVRIKTRPGVRHNKKIISS